MSTAPLTPESSQALVGLGGSWHQPVQPPQRLQCRAWPCWENPLPPIPDREMLFFIQWGKKNSRKPRAEH